MSTLNKLPAPASFPSKFFLSLSCCTRSSVLNAVIIAASTATSYSSFHMCTTLCMESDASQIPIKSVPFQSFVGFMHSRNPAWLPLIGFEKLPVGGQLQLCGENSSKSVIGIEIVLLLPCLPRCNGKYFLLCAILANYNIHEVIQWRK